jgi:2-polyprenyl-6-methoxyphenol hydroxylase-like FAD-dependent oxidoreductase
MYDATIVGARCAGSPTAMLLARKGYRVLLVDKASFPSDTISTHIIWPHGAEALDRWGLLERVAATGCPPTALNMVFDVGPLALTGGVTNTNGGRGGFCPRRTLLDKILVDAAVGSGVELRENFTVEALITEGDRITGIRGHSRNGRSLDEHSKIVIGADGEHSFVAKAVGAEDYEALPALAAFFYSYFSGIGAEDIEQYVREYHGAAYFPTNDGLALIAAVWPSKRFHEIRTDIEGNVMGVHQQLPVADRLLQARREEKWYGTVGVRNYFRKPFGPGWALVGDAGHEVDPITGQGINNAFLDAELLVDAIDAGFSGRRALKDAMADYQSKRDERTVPLHHFTTELATLEPPPPHVQQLFGALHGNREATGQFYSALTGSTPLQEFMNTENLGRIFAAAATPA